MSTLAMDTPLTRSGRNEPAGSEPLLPPALRRVLISVLAVLATLGVARLGLQRFDAPVRELVITGVLRHVQPDEVRLAAAPLVEANKLFALDLDGIRAAIERLPWVAQARIDRQWPARLGVRITEREPFARWGESEALSTEGVVFAPGSVVLANTLPKLSGAPGREREVMAMYGQLADQLSETPFALTTLTQDARGEWVGTTEQNITLRFGRSDPLEQVARLKNTVLPALGSRLDSAQRIDLRYANGFAVSWRDATETQIKTIPDQPAPGVFAPAAAPGVTP